MSFVIYGNKGITIVETVTEMDKRKLKKALDYFAMWVEHDGEYEIEDELAEYRKTAYEAIKECLEKEMCNADT